MRAFHREDRDDEIAAVGERCLDFLFEQCAAVVDRKIDAVAIAIGAFANDMVDADGTIRIRVKGFRLWAEIAREKQRVIAIANLARAKPRDTDAIS